MFESVLYRMLQVSCVYNTLSSVDEDSVEHKQLDEIISTSGLPALSVIQNLLSAGGGTTAGGTASNSTNGSLHASPNTTPQPTPPGTPSSIRKLTKLAQHGLYVM